METRNGNEGGSHPYNERVTASNGDGVAYRTSEATEQDSLLTVPVSFHQDHAPFHMVTCSNGESMLSGHAAEAQMELGNTHTPQEISSRSKIKGGLHEVVFWRVRVWMVIIFIFLLIFVVIVIFLVICSAFHEDPDEKFDHSLFKTPLYFNGSFLLPKMAWSEQLAALNYTSESLTADLQNKLADIYRYSPALGRYFSKAEIHVLWNSSAIADYNLTFLMPEEQQEELRNFTLSREMIYNVFRQFLYDQEPDSSGPMYIDPLSLKMF